MRLQPLPAGRRGPCKSRREPMCGIVGAVAERDVVPILMEGLRRLEYRGHDSAGLGVLNRSQDRSRPATGGKVGNPPHAPPQTPSARSIGPPPPPSPTAAGPRPPTRHPATLRA